jgi:nitroimidazol reductase NimA-like FMN-containing flavoprotein (pyridoxamine 5'-phosphate oxidase superfamily)
MNIDIESRATLERLVSGQRLAVLATNGPAGPYLSLVAFAASADRRSFYFATLRNTRKWANLERESRVALLLDDRPGGNSDFSRSAAATITGTARELSGEELKAALELYRARHPELAEFARSPGSALLKITVSDLSLVNGFK